MPVRTKAKSNFPNANRIVSRDVPPIASRRRALLLPKPTTPLCAQRSGLPPMEIRRVLHPAFVVCNRGHYLGRDATVSTYCHASMV
jgi:hypothetical protein